MPKIIAPLSALTVRDLSKPGLHAVGEVAGLMLQVGTPSATGTFSRSWILRARIGGKRRDVGLGGFPTVTLAEARERARVMRKAIGEGVDPVHARRTAKSALRADVASAITFEQAAQRFIATNESGWKNAKHAAQWSSTLKTYAFPVMGSLLVRDVATAHVQAAVEPIWQSKTETAKRVLNRIEMVLGWATASGFRTGVNPAQWNGHFENILPSASKLLRRKRRHHPALPIDEIGAFMVRLRGVVGVSARALEFAVLTAVRSGEVRGALWSEIDLARALWVIPALRMKAEKDHRVPLSDAAMHLLRSLERTGELVFPSPRGEKPLSDMSLTAILRRMNLTAVPHGMRSTFRDWVGERTAFPTMLAEMALAHAVKDKTEAAYARGDLFDKRRALMEAWAGFVDTVAVPVSDNVVALRRA